MSLRENTSASCTRPSYVTISGPSASGKTTLITRLCKEFKNDVGFSVSHTTRPRRKSEISSADYNFISKDEFQELINTDEFLEYANIGDHMYGTTKSAVKKVRDEGKIVIIDILAESALKLREILDPSPLLIYIKPPSLEVLERRLRARSTEAEEDIKRRMNASVKELEYEKYFDNVILNEDIDESYEKLKGMVIAAKL